MDLFGNKKVERTINVGVFVMSKKILLGTGTITNEGLFNGKQSQFTGAAENVTFKKAKRSVDKASSKG